MHSQEEKYNLWIQYNVSKIIKILTNKLTIKQRKKSLPTNLGQEVQWSRAHPLNPKKSLISVSGGQQRLSKVGAENVPVG